MSKTGLEHVSKRLRELADELDAGPDDPPAVTLDRLDAWGNDVASDIADMAAEVEHWVDGLADDEAGAA